MKFKIIFYTVMDITVRELRATKFAEDFLTVHTQTDSSHNPTDPRARTAHATHQLAQVADLELAQLRAIKK